jgi:sugar (pentulose or hexulose) kinase
VPEPAAPLALGLDLGTSALKAVLTDARGAILAQGSAPVATFSEVPGEAEQEPSGWLAAAAQAVAQIAAALPPGRSWRRQLKVIGLAGQLPTLVVLGPRGAEGRAITWKDARADAAAAAVIGTRRQELYRLTGMPLDGRYLAPMFRVHGGAHPQARRILSAKDYLCHALTGAELTDPSTAAGYGLYALDEGRFSAALCALWGIDPALLPQVAPAHSIAAPLSASGAQLLGLPAGIPVTVGAADSMSGAYAMAPLSPGVVCIAMGSSTIILDAVRERRWDAAGRYLLSPHAAAGWYAREMDLLATGTGYHWLCRLLRSTPEELEREASRAAPGAGGVSFMPYLGGGEQGALWNPALRGALAGLGLGSGRAEIARAFLEGVAFEIRRCVEVLAESQTLTEVVLAGGLAQSAFGLQLLANILGRPVRPYAHVSPAALGAARGALEALDPGARPGECATGPAVPPDGGQSQYDALYARYLAASAACA